MAKAATADSDGKIVEIRKRVPSDWSNLLKEAAEDHWRTLRVTIQIREWLMAGKPAQLDAAKAMLKARGLEAAIEAVNVDDPNALAAAAAEVVDEGLCEFHRREGRPGIWLPANNVKAMLKENWSVLGYRVKHVGSRGALAEGVFVFGVDALDLDWINLGEQPDGIHTAVSHTTGPTGPKSSINRREYLIRPKLVFDIKMAKLAVAGKRANGSDVLPDQALADTLLHAAEHGVGACRSQGYGRFNIESIVELD